MPEVLLIFNFRDIVWHPGGKWWKLSMSKLLLQFLNTVEQHIFACRKFSRKLGDSRKDTDKPQLYINWYFRLNPLFDPTHKYSSSQIFSSSGTITCKNILAILDFYLLAIFGPFLLDS